MALMHKLKDPYFLFGSVFLFGLLVFGTAMVYEYTYAPLPILGPQDEAKEGQAKYHTIPEFQLVNQFGDTVTKSHWRGKITIADFFFTHCPSICPKMTEHMKEIQEIFDHNDIQILSYSVDPVRDQPDQLMKYAETYEIDHENWTFLTGDKKQIYLLARNGYFISASEGSGGPDDFIHSDLFTLVDQKGRIRGYYRGTQDDDVDKLIHDIKKLKQEI